MRLPDLAQLAAEQLQAAVYALDKGAPSALVEAHAAVSIAATLQRIAGGPARVPAPATGAAGEPLDHLARNVAALAASLAEMRMRVDALEQALAPT